LIEQLDQYVLRYKSARSSIPGLLTYSLLTCFVSRNHKLLNTITLKLAKFSNCLLATWPKKQQLPSGIFTTKSSKENNNILLNGYAQWKFVGCPIAKPTAYTVLAANGRLQDERSFCCLVF